MLAGDRIELFRIERAETGVQVARVVQDHQTRGQRRRRANGAQKPGPIGDARIGDRATDRKREGVEVARSRRDFVPGDRCEEGPYALPSRRWDQVGEKVVVGGDRQLDPLAGQRDDPLVDRRIAVAAVRERVDVGIAGNHARRRHFTADRQPERVRLSFNKSERLRRHSVLESTRGEDRRLAGLQADAGPSVRCIDYSRAGGQMGTGLDQERREDALAHR